MEIDLRVRVAQAVLIAYVGNQPSGDLASLAQATGLENSVLQQQLSDLQGAEVLPISISSEFKYEIDTRKLPASRAQELLKIYESLLKETPRQKAERKKVRQEG